MIAPVEISRRRTKCPKGHETEFILGSDGRQSTLPLECPCFYVVAGDGVELDQVPSLKGFGVVCKSCRVVYWLPPSAEKMTRCSPIQLIAFALSVAAARDHLVVGVWKMIDSSIYSTSDQILGELTKRGMLDRKLQGDSHEKDDPRDGPGGGGPDQPPGFDPSDWNL